MHRRHPLIRPSRRVEPRGTRRAPRAPPVRSRGAGRAARGILGEAPAPARIDALLERSDGLPFYVEELVAAIAGRGRPAPIDAPGHPWAATGDPVARVARARRRPPWSAGRLPHERLAAASGMDEDALLGGAQEAIDPDPRPGRRLRRAGLRVPHALLREAAYDELLPAERVRLHARVADTSTGSIPPAADRSLDRRGLRAPRLPRPRPASSAGGLDRALLAFVDAVAYREALAHAERALELWPRVEDAASRAGIDHADCSPSPDGWRRRSTARNARWGSRNKPSPSSISPADRDRAAGRLATSMVRLGSAGRTTQRRRGERAQPGSSSGPTRLKAFGHLHARRGAMVAGPPDETRWAFEEAMAIAAASTIGRCGPTPRHRSRTRMRSSGRASGSSPARPLAEAVPMPTAVRTHARRAGPEHDPDCGRFAVAAGRRARPRPASRYGWDADSDRLAARLVDALLSLVDTARRAWPARDAGAGIHHIDLVATRAGTWRSPRGRLDAAHRVIDGVTPDRAGWSRTRPRTWPSSSWRARTAGSTSSPASGPSSRGTWGRST